MPSFEEYCKLEAFKAENYDSLKPIDGDEDGGETQSLLKHGDGKNNGSSNHHVHFGSNSTSSPAAFDYSDSYNHHHNSDNNSMNSSCSGSSDGGGSVSKRVKGHNNMGFNSSGNGNGNNNAARAYQMPSMRTLALELSLYTNLFITLTKLVAYIETLSLSVLAALLDSVLDVVSQIVLNYTEKHSSLQRSSAFYPAGASRLEPIGVLTCAALMGMASFEVLKESSTTLIYRDNPFEDPNHHPNILSFWSMVAIVFVKLLLLSLCNHASNAKAITSTGSIGSSSSTCLTSELTASGDSMGISESNTIQKAAIAQLSDPTLEALAQDHWNDALSNAVAAIALLAALKSQSLWFLDPIGAILISFYIIWSWYHTGKEQIEQLTGKSAPNEFIDELLKIADGFDDRMMVDVCRAYHFGPKFLVELEIVLPKDTLLQESHDLGMELQYEIEGREEVERCFVHIDYESRPYDEHVVSKVPELREKYRPGSSKLLRHRSTVSV